MTGNVTTATAQNRGVSYTNRRTPILKGLLWALISDASTLQQISMPRYQHEEVAQWFGGYASKVLNFSASSLQGRILLLCQPFGFNFGVFLVAVA